LLVKNRFFARTENLNEGIRLGKKIYPHQLVSSPKLKFLKDQFHASPNSLIENNKNMRSYMQEMSRNSAKTANLSIYNKLGIIMPICI